MKHSRSLGRGGLLCLALLLGACSRGQPDTTEIIRPVRVMALKATGAVSDEVYPGQVEPRYEASLGFQVGGRLLRRVVELGQHVDKGQVLAQIDPRDLALAQSAAQAQFAAAQADFQQAVTDLKRANTLKMQNFVSQAQVDRAQLARDAAESRLAQARSQLNAQVNQSAYGSLRAPGKGYITKIYAEAGQVLAPAQPVVQWAGEHDIQVRIAVPETRVDQFSAGQVATVKLWAEGDPLTAKVREVSPVADPVTRAYPVYLDLPGVDQKSARFGMSANVIFQRAQSDSAFKLPGTALVADEKGAWAWVFDPESKTVHRRAVKPFGVTESSFLVKDGLKAGDLVVIAGTHVLNEGQKATRFIEPADVTAHD
ncbi:efflux RND transporter periplasmic adaptor subunit [Limnobacter sp.]|uniref:efflux RND transporter periplasmic adaptor subunit n=1 Tax=Limnobacter sp. TaxID=2003368 RepID=UPI0025836D34|nr:efflux RND transporter periplasmic adaptor subunit [Limnobacter sp.]